MFRQMRRKKQELSREEAVEVLAGQKRGALSVVGDSDYPYGLPINYLYDRGDGCIYLHGAREGHKVDAISRNPRVCFTTWDDGVLDEDGWSFHVRSVVAFGTATLVTDPDVAYEKARALGLKYYPDASEVDEEMRKAASRVQMIAIRIDHLTGKRVHEK